MILWMTCERKAETSSSVEHFVMEDSQILTFEKLWMGYGPQFDLRAYAFPTRGPTGAYAKVRSENGFLKTSEKAFVSLISLSSRYIWIIQSSLHAKSLYPPRKVEHLNKRLRETAYAASPTLSYAICLRRTYAPSRTAYALMMLVLTQSKFHHLEKNVAHMLHVWNIYQHLPEPKCR